MGIRRYAGRTKGEKATLTSKRQRRCAGLRGAKKVRHPPKGIRRSPILRKGE